MYSQKILVKAVLFSTTLGLVLPASADDPTPAPASPAPVSAPAPTPAPDTVLAVVNGNPITQATYERVTANRPKRDRGVVIDELIKREVLLQDALQRSIDKQPEVIAELATQRENLLVGAAIKSLAETISSSDDELRKFYADHLNEFAVVEYKARHILVTTEDEAKAIIAELDKGADFAKLAKEKSKDNATDGGDLGWFNSSQMVKPFADAVATLPKGKYTAKPVHTEFGWHIILSEDTRKTTAPAFEKLKDKIKMTVQRTKLQEIIQALLAKAKVEVKVAK